MVVEIKIKSPQMLHLRAGALRYPHSVVDLPRAKFQGSKKTQGSERSVLLATTEDEAITAVPEVVRVAVAAVQPQLVVAVYDVEDAEATVGRTDGLHANEEPLTSGLILILQTQLGTRLVGAELEAELESSHVDVPPSGAILETELGHRDVEEIELHLGVRRREGGLVENVARQVTDAATCGLEGSAEVVGSLDTRAELDGLPCHEVTGCEFPGVLASEKPLECR